MGTYGATLLLGGAFALGLLTSPVASADGVDFARALAREGFHFRSDTDAIMLAYFVCDDFSKGKTFQQVVNDIEGFGTGPYTDVQAGQIFGAAITYVCPTGKAP